MTVNVVQKTDPDIVVLPETKRSSDRIDKTIEIPGYDVITAPRDDHGGGLFIYVNTKKWRYATQDSTDATATDSAIRIRLFPLSEAPPIDLTGIYNASRRITHEFMDKWVPDAGNPTLVLLDANAHHRQWDAHAQPDTAGQALKDWCDTRGFQTANDPSKFTREANQKHGHLRSSPDVVIHSTDFRISEWQVHDTFVSDHRPITFKAAWGSEDEEHVEDLLREHLRSCGRAQHAWQKADWPCFTADVEAAAAQILSTNITKPSALLKQLVGAIIDADRRHLPQGLAVRKTHPGVDGRNVEATRSSDGGKIQAQHDRQSRGKGTSPRCTY